MESILINRRLTYLFNQIVLSWPDLIHQNAICEIVNDALLFDQGDIANNSILEQRYFWHPDFNNYWLCSGQNGRPIQGDFACDSFIIYGIIALAIVHSMQFGRCTIQRAQGYQKLRAYIRHIDDSPLQIAIGIVLYSLFCDVLTRPKRMKVEQIKTFERQMTIEEKKAFNRYLPWPTLRKMTLVDSNMFFLRGDENYSVSVSMALLYKWFAKGTKDKRTLGRYAQPVDNIYQLIIDYENIYVSEFPIKNINPFYKTIAKTSFNQFLPIVLDFAGEQSVDSLFKYGLGLFDELESNNHFYQKIYGKDFNINQFIKKVKFAYIAHDQKKLQMAAHEILLKTFIVSE